MNSNSVTHVIEGVTIAALSSRQYIEDEDTGEFTLDPVYGYRHSVELMLAEGTSVSDLRCGGTWRLTLVGDPTEGN